MAALNRLGELHRPVFGQVALSVVLIVSVSVLCETNLEFSNYDRGVPVSIIGYLFPSSWLSEPNIFNGCKLIFGLAALSWSSVPFLGRCRTSTIRLILTISSWTAVVTYTVVASMFWENLPFFLHKYVLPAWLLLIHAFWYHFYSDDIISALQQRRFWKTALYPQWVFFLSVFVISMLYTFAGLSKLRVALEWGNGLSLQLWTYMFGDRDSPVAEFILSDRANAAILQNGTLITECLAFLSLLNCKTRALIGAGLFFMHLAVYITFHIDFIPYMILLFVYFMPFFEWANRKRPDAVEGN